MFRADVCLSQPTTSEISAPHCPRLHNRAGQRATAVIEVKVWSCLQKMAAPYQFLLSFCGHAIILKHLWAAARETTGHPALLNRLQEDGIFQSWHHLFAARNTAKLATTHLQHHRLGHSGLKDNIFYKHSKHPTFGN